MAAPLWCIANGVGANSVEQDWYPYGDTGAEHPPPSRSRGRGAVECSSGYEYPWHESCGVLPHSRGHSGPTLGSSGPHDARALYPLHPTPTFWVCVVEEYVVLPGEDCRLRSRRRRHQRGVEWVEWGIPSAGGRRTPTSAGHAGQGHPGCTPHTEARSRPSQRSLTPHRSQRSLTSKYRYSAQARGSSDRQGAETPKRAEPAAPSSTCGSPLNLYW